MIGDNSCKPVVLSDLGMASRTMSKAREFLRISLAIFLVSTIMLLILALLTLRLAIPEVTLISKFSIFKSII